MTCKIEKLMRRYETFETIAHALYLAVGSAKTDAICKADFDDETEEVKQLARLEADLREKFDELKGARTAMSNLYMDLLNEQQQRESA